MQSVLHTYNIYNNNNIYMESANFHDYHQQEDHQLVDSSFCWSPNPISKNGTTNNINSRNLLDTCSDSMIQDLGFPSYNVGMGYPFENYDVTHELQRIKDEFSVAAESYPNFLQLLNCSPASSIEDLHLQPYSSYSNNNQDFSLASFTGGCQIKGGQIINDRNCCNGTFSQIFSTTGILSLNQSTTTTTSSSSAISSISPFDINCLPALDLFGSPRSVGRGGSYGFDHGMHHQLNHRPAAPVCPNKISSRPVVVSNSTGSRDESTKRPRPRPAIGDAKATQQTLPLKKPKSEPRSSSAAPFQVRKEKLGVRIAAIQQLVAPFGKTDTASVLMEAIGYIKFLQTQVQTLSVPYMKSTNKLIGGLSSSSEEERGQMEDGNTKRDLRSRGLCLVPLSCLSYVVTDGCEGIWPT